MAWPDRTERPTTDPTPGVCDDHPMASPTHVAGTHVIAASFDPDDERVATAHNGGVARAEMIEHRARFDRRLHTVADGVWCVVGNGLSNQTFVEGPDGLIVIDTGDSTEEMAWALAQVRELTDNFVVPAAACPTYRAMLEQLTRFDQDMAAHIYKEDKVLFPRALQTQAALRGR